MDFSFQDSSWSSPEDSAAKQPRVLIMYCAAQMRGSNSSLSCSKDVSNIVRPTWSKQRRKFGTITHFKQIQWISTFIYSFLTMVERAKERRIDVYIQVCKFHHCSSWKPLCRQEASPSWSSKVFVTSSKWWRCKRKEDGHKILGKNTFEGSERLVSSQFTAMVS